MNGVEDLVEELFQGAKQNGGSGMILDDETDEFNDDNYQEECHEGSAEVVKNDKQTELMKKAFHANIYKILPRRYPDLAFIRATESYSSYMSFPPSSVGFYIANTGYSSWYLYVAHVLMIEWNFGVVQTIEEAEDFFDKFTDKARYKFCPGIDQDYYTEYYEIIQFHIRVSGK